MREVVFFASFEHTASVRKLDGGLSTALEERGNILTGSLWTGELLRTAPKEIEKAHRAFVDAGAQIITSSAYQISFTGCAERGWSDRDVIDALILSTALVREAANGNAPIAASIGPYGAALADGSEYRGRYAASKSAIREFHKQRLEVLITTEPDYLALETMPDIDEVEILVDLIAQSETKIPFWVAYSCKEGALTNAGQRFSEAVALVCEQPGAMAVGVNCTAPELIAPLLRSPHSSLPFIVYPNAGRTWDAKAKQWVGSPKRGFETDMIAEWIELGAEIIGGCCGISPKDIEKMELS